jgi:hypothetical protein
MICVFAVFYIVSIFFFYRVASCLSRFSSQNSCFLVLKAGFRLGLKFSFIRGIKGPWNTY